MQPSLTKNHFVDVRKKTTFFCWRVATRFRACFSNSKKMFFESLHQFDSSSELEVVLKGCAVWHQHCGWEYGSTKSSLYHSLPLGDFESGQNRASHIYFSVNGATVECQVLNSVTFPVARIKLNLLRRNNELQNVNADKNSRATKSCRLSPRYMRRQ